MSAAVQPETRVEITAESFEGLDLQQQNEIAAALGKQELRGVTLEMLREETLQLTDFIAELVEQGNNGDPEGYIQAGELAKQKKQIADILHGNSVSTNDFARPTADNEFSFHLPGPTTDQTQETYIREQLKDSPDEAEMIINRLKELGVDVTEAAPALNEGVLKMDSNDKTLQEQREFYKDVGGLADPKQAVNLCIEAVKQAREKEIDLRTINNESWDEKGDRIYTQAIEAGLGEGAASMLKALTAGSVIRAQEGCSRPVALYVILDGRLYAVESGCYADASDRALGRGARAAE